MALFPALSFADAFAFNLDIQSFGNGHHDFDEIDADLEHLSADLVYTGSDWELSVRYKVETEDAPPGQCDLVFDVVDYAAPPVRFTIRLDRPAEVDDEELIYRARTNVRLGQDQIRDPKHVRLFGYLVPAGGGPVIDREDTRIRFRH